MAKGNLFLGTARGSVGDVTMYQNRGQQAARVRKRVIANPQSDGQILSRAIIGTVSRAYSAGRVIFDHSFEGRKQGQECQDRFLELNTNLLRTVYVDDITNSRAPMASKGRFCAKGASGPVPFSFIVSEGSLVQSFFRIVQPSALLTNRSPELTMPLEVSTQQNPMTLGGYMVMHGLVNGDIYTIVCIGYDDMGNWSTQTSYPATFGFVRMTVNATDASKALDINQALWQQLFEFEFYGQLQPDLSDAFFTSPISNNETVDIMTLGLEGIGALGIIRSRDDSGARSYCRLTCTYDFSGMAAEDYNWGIPSPALVDAWNGTAFSYNSELILEGGNIQEQLDKAGK